MVLAAAMAGAAVWLLLPDIRPLPGTAPTRRTEWRIPIGAAARQRAAARRSAAINAVTALAAELRAGQPTATALQRAGAEYWPHAIAAGRLGGDVAEALRVDAEHAPVLFSVAACWSVTAQTGSGLATALTRVAEAGRIDEDVRVQLEAQLAGPRATARMLGFLPVIGLLLGTALGADPIAWLLGSPFGVLCLVLGVLCTALGMAWTGRIARQVEGLL